MTFPVILTGKITHGRHLATGFGMPTANTNPVEDTSDLARGVYYSVITVDENDYPAITNLGIRPTVSDDGRVNAETFIYGYTGDLYGKIAKIKLIGYRRAERRFDSTEELFLTIADDIRAGADFHKLPEDALPATLTSSSMASV